MLTLLPASLAVDSVINPGSSSPNRTQRVRRGSTHSDPSTTAKATAFYSSTTSPMMTRSSRSLPWQPWLQRCKPMIHTTRMLYNMIHSKKLNYFHMQYIFAYIYLVTKIIYF